MTNIPASSVLKEIQGQQPRQPELVKKLQKMLEQYGVTPQTEELIAQSTIPQLLQEAELLAQSTGDKLFTLRAETMICKRVGEYGEKITLLSRKNSEAVRNIMFQDYGKQDDGSGLAA